MSVNHPDLQHSALRVSFCIGIHLHVHQLEQYLLDSHRVTIVRPRVRALFLFLQFSLRFFVGAVIFWSRFFYLHVHVLFVVYINLLDAFCLGDCSRVIGIHWWCVVLRFCRAHYACCACRSRFSHSPCVRPSAFTSSFASFFCSFCLSSFICTLVRKLMNFISVEQSGVVKFLSSYCHGRWPVFASIFQSSWSWCLISCGCVARGLCLLSEHGVHSAVQPLVSLCPAYFVHAFDFLCIINISKAIDIYICLYYICIRVYIYIYIYVCV